MTKLHEKFDTAYGEQITYRQLYVVFGSLMLGMLLAALDQTIVSTALPTIVGDLGGINYLSWVVTSYLLASTLATPVYGKLGDSFGRKPLFIIAIIIFLIGSALSGLSQNIGEIVGFRAIQGLGAGGLMVGAQAIIGDIVPPRERGRFVGAIGSVFALSSVAGPLLGGFLVDNWSWRWIFYINIPLGAIALFVITTRLHLPMRHARVKLDYLGVTVLSALAASVILFTTWGGVEYSWSSPIILALIVAALVLIPVFIMVENKSENPVIPIYLFRNLNLSLTFAVSTMIGAAMFGSIIFLPLFLQVVDGASPTVSGLELLPLVAGLMATMIFSGRIITKSGKYRFWPIGGTLVLIGGFALLGTLQVHTSHLLSSLYMLVIGVGVGSVMQVMVLVAQNSVQHKDLGVVTSTVTFFRTIGGAVGTAVFGTIFSSRLISQLHTLPSSATAHLPKGGGLNVNPNQIHHLPQPIKETFLSFFVNSLSTAFYVTAGIAAIAFVLTLLMKEVPLRSAGPSLEDAASL